MDANELNSAIENEPGAAPGNLTTVRLYLFVMLVLAAFGLFQLSERGKLSGHLIGGYSAQWVVLLGITTVLFLIELIVFVLLWTGARKTLFQLARESLGYFHSRKWLAVGAAIVPWIIYVVVVLYRYQKHFADLEPQVWLFWLAAGIGALFLSAVWRKTAYFSLLLFVAIVYSAGIKALGYLPEISAYPFSLAWSEASRYYYASLPFSQSLFGIQIPLSFLHPTRYLLQSLAFLAPDGGLWFHRFWQVFLWLALSSLTGWALARRFPRLNLAEKIALTLWSALFLLQGPVYYHLLICVILVLFGFDRRKFWKTMVFVVLGSAWAGISRVNWIPVPAMLAAAMYILETPVCEDQTAGSGLWNGIEAWMTRRGWPAVYRWLHYLWPPLAWGAAGGAAALGSYAAYLLVSGHEDTSKFNSTFTSALLLYRLLPSATSGIGVLPIILLVSLPLLAAVIGNWYFRRAGWHWLRIFGLSAMLLLLFAGGLVVSTKIGGGSGIHNLDAFLTLLLVVATSMLLGKAAPETRTRAGVWKPWPLLLAITALPVVLGINIGDPFVRRDFAQAEYDLNKLNKIVQQYAPEGEILFITQRQLQMFDLVPGVKMAPDYELLTLTEMSISHNQAYFDQFYQDLKNHRYALIVANQQNTVIKNSKKDSFAEENNAWVEYVAQPLLKYYQEKMFFDTQGIQLLVPKK